MVSITRGRMLAVALVVLSPLVLNAHHAASMFEPEREVTITGVVKEFQYTNPHSWLPVDVTNIGLQPVVEMNLIEVRTQEFFAQFMRFAADERHLQPGERGNGTNWEQDRKTVPIADLGLTTIRPPEGSTSRLWTDDRHDDCLTKKRGTSRGTN